MIRVVLADDHALVRIGLQRLLEQSGDIEVAGTADRGDTAVTLTAETRPDVVLMDLSIPGIDGIEATRQICAAESEAAVVVLTASTDPNAVRGAIDAGAVGYLVKDADPTDVITGVRAAAKGDAPFDPRAAKALLNRPVGDRALIDLTDRERQVLGLVAEGLANKLIARRLGISEKTVKAHLTRIFAELGVTDRTQAALWVERGGLRRGD